MESYLAKQDSIVSEELLFAYLQMLKMLSRGGDFIFLMKDLTIENELVSIMHDQLVQGYIENVKVLHKEKVSTLGKVREISLDDYSIYQDIKFPVNKNQDIIPKIRKDLENYIDKFIEGKLHINYKNIYSYKKQVHTFMKEVEEKNLIKDYGFEFLYVTPYKTFDNSDYLPVHTLFSQERKKNIKINKIYPVKNNSYDLCFHVQILNKKLFSENKLIQFNIKKEEDGYYFIVDGYAPLFYGIKKREEIKLLEKFTDSNTKLSKDELGYSSRGHNDSFRGIVRRINEGIDKNGNGLSQIGFILESESVGKKYTYSIHKKRT